jgi:hypothetical protein
MSTQQDYTAEEWKAISVAPFLAGLYVSMSDPSGLVGVAKEAMAVGRLIAETGLNSSTELIKSLSEGFKGGGERPEMPDIPKRDLAAARAAMAEHLQKAAAAISAKSPAEAEAYKAWLMAAAKKVAEASKEGGFFGFGGTLVSDQEQAAIKELAARLGVNA